MIAAAFSFSLYMGMITTVSDAVGAGEELTGFTSVGLFDVSDIVDL